MSHLQTPLFESQQPAKGASGCIYFIYCALHMKWPGWPGAVLWASTQWGVVVKWGLVWQERGVKLHRQSKVNKMSLTALKKKRSSREKNLVRFCWSNKDHNLSLRVWSPFGRENTETKETRLKNKYLNTKHDKHRAVVESITWICYLIVYIVMWHLKYCSWKDLCWHLCKNILGKER